MLTPAFDSAATANTGTATAASLTFAKSNSGSNGLLLVNVGIRGSETVSTVTHNGSGLTLVAGISSANDSGRQVRDELWKLVAPSASGNVVITPSAAARFSGEAVSYTNVDPTTPHGTPVTHELSAEPASISTNISSIAGELVVDGICRTRDHTGKSLDVGALQTERAKDWTTNADVDLNATGATSEEAGATTVTMSWSSPISSNLEWAHVLISLKPAPAAGSLVFKSIPMQAHLVR